MENIFGKRNHCVNCKHYQRFYVMYDYETFFPAGRGFCTKQGDLWKDVETRDETEACVMWEPIEVPPQIKTIKESLATIAKEVRLISDLIEGGKGKKRKQ